MASLVVLCSCKRSNAVVVGSKNFTEQIILGEIAAQQIERKLHMTVDRRLGLGGTLLAHEALVKGELDLYPEYTGTASYAVLKKIVSADPLAGYLQIKDAYRDQFHLIWLPPLGFNDTFAMVVRSSDAQRLAAQSPGGKPALSAASSRSWRLGVGYEFLTRPDGLRRLDSTYGFHWQDAPATMDLGLLYQALSHNNVDLVAANSTDGILTAKQYTILADDKHAFPSYNACYVVREDVLKNRPGLEAALNLLSNRISDDTMRNLNRQVDLQHRPVVQVVREFLSNEP